MMNEDLSPENYYESPWFDAYPPDTPLRGYPCKRQRRSLPVWWWRWPDLGCQPHTSTHVNLVLLPLPSLAWN